MILRLVYVKALCEPEWVNEQARVPIATVSPVLTQGITTTNTSVSPLSDDWDDWENTSGKGMVRPPDPERGCTSKQMISLPVSRWRKWGSTDG